MAKTSSGKLRNDAAKPRPKVRKRRRVGMNELPKR
jgi:hypothetical protein